MHARVGAATIGAADSESRPHANVQTKCALTDRISIRLTVTYALRPSIFVQYPPKLDRSSQRTLIPAARSSPRVLLRFLTPGLQSTELGANSEWLVLIHTMSS